MADQKTLFEKLSPNPVLAIDPDVQGHYLVVLADYHSLLDKQLESGKLGASDYGYACYMLGNLEGRLLGNQWTWGDYELASVWEQEVEEENKNGRVHQGDQEAHRHVGSPA